MCRDYNFISASYMADHKQTNTMKECTHHEEGHVFNTLSNDPDHKQCACGELEEQDEYCACNGSPVNENGFCENCI